jgi:hypothetical protein
MSLHCCSRSSIGSNAIVLCHFRETFQLLIFDSEKVYWFRCNCERTNLIAIVLTTIIIIIWPVILNEQIPVYKHNSFVLSFDVFDSILYMCSSQPHICECFRHKYKFS